MEWFAGARVALTPRPSERRVAALEVAMLGHAPGRARFQRLAAMPAALDDMRAAGFGRAVDEILLLAQLETAAGGNLTARWLRGTAIDKDGLLANMTVALHQLRTERLHSEALDYALLDTVADKLVLTKTLDDVLQAELLGPLLNREAVDSAGLLAQLQAALSAVPAGNDLLGEFVAAWTAMPSVDPAALAQAADLLLDRLIWSRSRGLFQLPLPLQSGAEFRDLFPDAASAATRYRSVLAGATAWLPQAVTDFFANGGDKLWVIRIPEDQGQDGFLPLPDTELFDTERLRGLALALVVQGVGVLAMPDLERLQVPPRLPDIPGQRLDGIAPEFLPCTQQSNTLGGPYPAIEQMPAPRAFNQLIGLPLLTAAADGIDMNQAPTGVLRWLFSLRPDIQCLWTLPLNYSGELDSPVLDPAVLTELAAYQAQPGSGQALRHMQFLAPYLRGPGVGLSSPVGLIAGRQSAVARRDGPWRSVAAQPLQSELLPYPYLNQAQTLQLRETPGIGVLRYRRAAGVASQLALDDERLVVPALLAIDHPLDKQRYDGFRSAEVMRFLGFLRRQLQALGEQLIFNVDVRDPRPRLVLEQFFRRLYLQGALRGGSAEQAFSIKQSAPQEGAIAFEIMVAPAFPVDRVFLTFTNLDGEWRSEVTGG